MTVAFLCLPCRRVCHNSRVSSLHASQQTNVAPDLWFSRERVRWHSHSNAIATGDFALKRATPRLHLHATAHASRAQSSWGKFGRKPSEYSHLSPRLRAAIEKKNEEKLAFQHIELPVEVYPEPPQTVTTEEDLDELARLQPSTAKLAEWRIAALRDGRYTEATDLRRLVSRVPYQYFLLDHNAPSRDLDWQFVDMLARGRECSRLAAEDNIRPYNDPVDGATINAYLLERISWRLDSYRYIEQSLTMVFNIAIPAMVNIARRSRRTYFWLARLLPGKTVVRRYIIRTEEMLFIVKTIIQNRYLILGRNLLLVDEQMDRVQGWKQNLNRVTAGWVSLRNVLDRLPSEPVARFINFPVLRALFTAMLDNTREIKYLMKSYASCTVATISQQSRT